MSWAPYVSVLLCVATLVLLWRDEIIATKHKVGIAILICCGLTLTIAGLVA